MHVRNMILCLGTLFLVAAAFTWANFDPDMTSGESSALATAYSSYNTLYRQGRYSEAEPYAKEAIRLGMEELGPNDPTTAALLDNLADLYRAQGQYGAAEPHLVRSRKLYATSDDADPRSRFEATGHLVLLLTDMGRLRDGWPRTAGRQCPPQRARRIPTQGPKDRAVGETAPNVRLEVADVGAIGAGDAAFQGPEVDMG